LTSFVDGHNGLIHEDANDSSGESDGNEDGGNDNADCDAEGDAEGDVDDDVVDDEDDEDVQDDEPDDDRVEGADGKIQETDWALISANDGGTFDEEERTDESVGVEGNNDVFNKDDEDGDSAGGTRDEPKIGRLKSAVILVSACKV
jgi:hypothetical protein